MKRIVVALIVVTSLMTASPVFAQGGDGSLRGSHVSWRHPASYPVMQALIAAGVIGDCRPPDLLRFGFAPLYISYADVWRAVTRLAEILRTRAWDRPEYCARRLVT